ncbi:nucleotide sugar dehydrogenase [Dyadobacter sediminis]|uniref:Nucleotide sugar dehydrogenase n=1 Tax=Dyadobacter sediminis TaxID=1493691 RepID=A0A5R9K980_9BACT|nr:nucleotide sugar dehydrogenase [Dyadobacter sediminis]TLU90632.1 nucleotide sugar dehydrogenase [Dyadobacter sediminis]GGC09407.1 UDP-glucose/GDP-mannose dehydrogenase [Dyadobacter sediminis]
MHLQNKEICVIGLGYVGLPLAVEFGKIFKTIGLDIDQQRINELNNQFDRTLEVDAEGLKSASKLRFTVDPDDIRQASIFIITVPTPVDQFNNPDLTPVRKATETVAHNLKSGDIVIYESTVYPGVTEDYCVPILEKISGLTFNQDFFCGYSPERINPGDKHHTLTKIRKVTSGSTPEIAEEVNKLYGSIITAGTFKASSIKVAESAKVIENAQRDINIAFVNELAKIFNLLKIDTSEVLEAAGTKWNFLPFKPGLVGGHCIGVDPFYLAQKAKEVGYHPEIILAGRRLNDSMGPYVASQFIKLLIQSERKIKGQDVLVLGITFKENCPDIRNSRVIDIIRELESYEMNVHVYDPWADKKEVQQEYGITLIDHLEKIEKYQGIVAAVGHDQLLDLQIPSGENGPIVYDVKGIFPREKMYARL